MEAQIEGWGACITVIFMPDVSSAVNRPAAPTAGSLDRSRHVPLRPLPTNRLSAIAVLCEGERFYNRAFAG